MDHRQGACLLLVDLQIDFMPDGALPVADGDALIAPIRSLLESHGFDSIVATQDWHPARHISFAGSHDGRKPFETMELYGHPQVLWPPHCVAGTRGAALHPQLPLDKVSAIVRKGMDPTVDAYSGFRNNWNERGERPPTGLGGYLKELGIVKVYVCGLARDFCVRWTAEDAAALGFETSVLWDLTRGVDPARDAEIRRTLISRSIQVVDSTTLPP